MNHTKRIAETARRHRHLTRRLAKESIETYLELLAEEIAQGDWVDIHGVGKIQVVREQGSGTLWATDRHGNRVKRDIRVRLRTKVRLFEALKKQCYQEE